MAIIENQTIILYYQPQVIEDIVNLLGSDARFKNLLKSIHLNKIKHFLSYLYLKPIIDRRYEDRSEYVHVSASFMDTMYTWKTYNLILKGLQKYNIIEKSPKNYKVGERTNAYRINPKYAGYKFATIECDPKLAKKQLDYRKLKASEQNHHPQQVLEKLEDIFRSITIDFKAAQQHIYNDLIFALNHPEVIEIKKHQYVKKNKFRPKKEYTTPEYEFEVKRLLKEVRSVCGENVVISHKGILLEHLQKVMYQYHFDMISIMRIHYGEFTFRLDSTSGRIHTNLTNLRSELRDYIRLDGQPIIGRDLVSSQLVFLSCLLVERYLDEVMPDDVQEFIQLCLDGGMKGKPDIYNFIKQQNNLTETRKEVKIIFYEKVLFSSTPTRNYPKVTKAFIKSFPSVWAFIVELKGDDHARCAVALQTLESRLFIGAADEVLEHGIKVLTLHDALYIQASAENKKIVDRIILSRFWSQYKIKPTISE
ncbi:hypothetical protein [Nafulsella turpanensis]|uniref:hypothetical protein n=1 Tax=Nafulsella turpanensis TaxID=1265690 RepID=UPI0003451144|nr:hypothetical protein [Nafulsella turpanensis]